MKGFPFKRHLILLVTAILLIGIMVPLATFAKSNKGEPHHALLSSKVTQHVDPFLGITTVTVTTDALCGTSSTTVVPPPTLKKGDRVVGSAKVTPINDPNEASEGETLVLLEQNSQFTKPIATIGINDGDVLVTFTAAVDKDTL